MSIDGKYGHFIHGLLINNQQTCYIGRIRRGRIMREAVTVRTVYSQKYRHCKKGGS